MEDRREKLIKMSSKSPHSKPKPLTFPLLIFFSLVFLLLNVAYHLKGYQYLMSVIQLENDHYLKRLNLPRHDIKKPSWYEVIANATNGRKMKVGIVNLESDEIYELYVPLDMIKVNFSHVSDEIKWNDLFSNRNLVRSGGSRDCPKIIPMPHVEDYGDLDVVVARVPCSGKRDVFRLQVNLVVANVLVESGHNGERMVYAVFLGSCGPMLEIFRCDDLLWKQDSSWIYKADFRRLKQKVVMPVGPCQIGHPIAEPGEEEWRQYSPSSITTTHTKPREAYVTVLHSSERYVCGAIALAQSLIQSKTKKDLILLADDFISPQSIQDLTDSGWKIKKIERIRSPHAEKKAYNRWNYSKLRIWQLHEYDKVMFIDSDFIVLKNIDKFFSYPQLSASANREHIFNSGIMLIEPSECTFKTLMEQRFSVASYNGGDQGFLNEIFTWWHKWPKTINHLKHFKNVTRDAQQDLPENVYAVHYLGWKPWLCYQDYDCNWDEPNSQQFASDLLHKRWWEVYRGMPRKLRKYCDLTPPMDARLKRWREKAKNASFPDGHWRIKIKDPRVHSLSP